MKIGNHAAAQGLGPVGGATTPSTRPNEATSASGTAAEAATPGASTVQLSRTAQALMSTDGSFDAQKVSQVRQAIADGSYAISPDAIADKLITNARELLSRGNAA